MFRQENRCDGYVCTKKTRKPFRVRIVMPQSLRVAPVPETQLEVLTSYLQDDSDKKDEVKDFAKVHLAVT